MLSEIASTAFIPMVAILMADGSEVTAVGDSYPTFESCRVQADHDAKIMTHEAEKLDSGQTVIKNVRVWCEPMPDNYQPHHGYIPEYREGRHE